MGEADLLKKYKEVCADLNLDRAAADEAWQSMQRIRINYTLEVSISCLMFVIVVTMSATTGRTDALVGLCTLCLVPKGENSHCGRKADRWQLCLSDPTSQMLLTQVTSLI
jgi:hypothetical protein